MERIIRTLITWKKKLNWKGICIEADSNLFRKVKSCRNCICVNECIDYKTRKVKYTLGRGGRGGIIDKGTLNEYLNNSDKFEYKKTKTLEDILVKFNAPKVIDYLSLDVEGSEYRVLKKFPFSKYVFLSLTIENPNDVLKKLLKKNGYIKVGSKNCDLLYVHHDFEELNK